MENILTKLQAGKQKCFAYDIFTVNLKQPQDGGFEVSNLKNVQIGGQIRLNLGNHWREIPSNQSTGSPSDLVEEFHKTRANPRD